MQAIWAGLTRAAANNSRVDSQTAFHQSSGFCSAQPGLGVERASGLLAEATLCPFASTASAFTLPVPMSRPTKTEEEPADLAMKSGNKLRATVPMQQDGNEASETVRRVSSAVHWRRDERRV